MSTVNLESGMPTVERARLRLDQELRTARARRIGVVKLIHGYGSTGKGGAIKRDVHAVLAQKQRQGQIKLFVPGERFSPFDPQARQIIGACPQLSRDRDYARCNSGITYVLL